MSFYCLFMLAVAGNTYFPLKSLFLLLSNFPFQWLYDMSFSFALFSPLAKLLSLEEGQCQSCPNDARSET